MAEFMGINIEKGQTVGIEAIVKRAKKPVDMRSQARVAMAVMNFAKLLEKHLRKEGYQANVRATTAGATWLTDEAAVKFNVRRRCHGERKVRRAVKGFNSIDETKLDGFMRHEYERESRLAAQKASALRKYKSATDFAKPATVVLS